MYLSIEDILRSHQLAGGGGGAGLEVIKQPTEPKDNLRDGVLWFNTSTKVTRIYLDGAFRELGGSGGTMITPFFGRHTLSFDATGVAVLIDQYNPVTDILLISQNGIAITEGIDYTLDKQKKSFTKKSGMWKAGTSFDFTVLAVTTTNANVDNVTLVQLEDHVTAIPGANRIFFTISGFNPDTDILRVHQDNVEIFRNQQWTLASGGSSITLNYTLKQQAEFHFTVFKKMRDRVPDGTVDGGLMIDDSVTEAKLEPALRQKIKEAANEQINGTNILDDTLPEEALNPALREKLNRPPLQALEEDPVDAPVGSMWIIVPKADEGGEG